MGVKRTEDRICVGAVLVRERDDDRHDASLLVLLGRREAGRAFYPDVWDVLGGHLEPGRPPSRHWSENSGRRQA
jgi:hypothetical protein